MSTLLNQCGADICVQYDLFSNYSPDIMSFYLRKSVLLPLVCLAEIVLLLAWLPITFEENDDLIMNLIVSGQLTGEPSEFIAFSNILIGLILKQFYLWLPTINWYTWYLVTVFFLGYLGLQYSIVNGTKTLRIKLIKHFLVLGLTIFSVLMLQFTRVAIIAILSGIIILLFAEQKQYFKISYGILLIIIGAAVRFEVFLMYILLSLPLILYVIKEKKYHVLMNLSVAAIIVGGMFVFEEYYYNQHPDFKAYKTYNKIRTKITNADNPDFTYTNKKHILDEIGWTEHDFYLATNFNLDIGLPKFSEKNLQKLISNQKPRNTALSIKTSFEDVFRAIFAFLNNKYYFIFYLFIIPFLIEADNKKRIYFLLIIIHIILVAFFLRHFMSGNLKGRVVYGMFLPLSIYMIYNLKASNITEINFLSLITKNQKINIFVFIAFTFAAMNIISYYRGTPLLEKRLEKNRMITSLIESQKDEFYVSWLDMKDFPLFSVPKSHEKVYILGWLVNSPFNKDKIERITGNRNHGIYNVLGRDIAWYFTNNYYLQAGFDTLIKNFYLSNYSHCKFSKQTYALSGNDTIYKLIFHIPIDTITKPY